MLRDNLSDNFLDQFVFIWREFSWETGRRVAIVKPGFTKGGRLPGRNSKSVRDSRSFWPNKLQLLSLIWQTYSLTVSPLSRSELPNQEEATRFCAAILAERRYIQYSQAIAQKLLRKPEDFGVIIISCNLVTFILTFININAIVLTHSTCMFSFMCL